MDDFQAELEKLAELSEEWRDHFNEGQINNLPRATADDEERRRSCSSLTTGQSLQAT